ncbi:MAG: alpha/beta hydrolase [Rudanella sp.]|nr:alpha/beta hydrolase [Rudanella sp.]
MLLFTFTFQTAAWIVAGYVALCLLAYWIQERFIFKPEKLSSDFEYKYNTPFKELHFSVGDNAHINGLLFYSAIKPKRGLLMYFHGNTRSVKGWSKYARDFSRYGYDVLMIDYRGYGKSFGKRTETNLKKDAEHIYHRMRFEHHYPENQIVVYGRSLGSGFATKLASVTRCKMLILDAPYYSFSQLTNRFLPFLPVSIILRFKIRTDQWIKYVRCPVYIINGTKERLIPLS